MLVRGSRKQFVERESVVRKFRCIVATLWDHVRRFERKYAVGRVARCANVPHTAYRSRKLRVSLRHTNLTLRAEKPSHIFPFLLCAPSNYEKRYARGYDEYLLIRLAREQEIFFFSTRSNYWSDRSMRFSSSYTLGADPFLRGVVHQIVAFKKNVIVHRTSVGP